MSGTPLAETAGHVSRYNPELIPAAAAEDWVFTAEAQAANPEAKMPFWAAFIAADAPADPGNPLGDIYADQAARSAAREAAKKSAA